MENSSHYLVCVPRSSIICLPTVSLVMLYPFLLSSRYPVFLAIKVTHYFLQLLKQFHTSLPFIPCVPPAWNNLLGIEIVFILQFPVKCHFFHNIALEFLNGILSPYLIVSRSFLIHYFILTCLEVTKHLSLHSLSF